MCRDCYCSHEQASPDSTKKPVWTLGQYQLPSAILDGQWEVFHWGGRELWPRYRHTIQEEEEREDRRSRAFIVSSYCLPKWWTSNKDWSRHSILQLRSRPGGSAAWSPDGHSLTIHTTTTDRCPLTTGQWCDLYLLAVVSCSLSNPALTTD